MEGVNYSSRFILFSFLRFVQCVVQSYLKWLEDSDFDPVCVFCSQSLEEGEVVRLVCFGE